MQKTILFDPLTAADVKSRIDTINRENNYLNGIILTVARMNGAPPNAAVGLNAEGTGVVISVQFETTGFVGEVPPDGGKMPGVVIHQPDETDALIQETEHRIGKKQQK